MQKFTFFIICAIFLFAASCKTNPTPKVSNPPAPEKPNVVFVLVDDLGIMDLGFTGSAYYETPNIDKLAQKSFVFSQGYASSRVCSPSRASILTGKSTARHGITDWIGAKSGESWRSTERQDKMLPAPYVTELPKEDITLAEAMKANGYKTFFAGKWHLGDEGSYPEDHGFDINKGGFESGSPKGGYFSPYQNPKLKDGKPGENLTMRLAQETTSFIDGHKDQPFFAFLSFYAVHGPLQTSKDKWKKYQQKAEKMGIKERGFENSRKLPTRIVQDNPVYGGLVESMDDAVGHLMDYLETSGMDKNTIVVFTSDNGGVVSGDGFSSSMLPYKGGKGLQWEGGIREPYLIYIPWLKNQIRTIDVPVTGADFYPTLSDFTNANLLPNQHQDGVSLKNLIVNNQPLKERSLYWHYPHYGNQGGDPSSIIRRGKWKLIHYYEDRTNELYDLEKDPYESTDVAAANKELAASLYQELSTYLQSVNAKYPTVDTQFNPKKRVKRDKNVQTNTLKELEEKRMRFLNPNFKPNDKWWNSQSTKD